LGAYAVVVGTAITRPHLITERFASALRKQLQG
jgi:putative N-acetylmannosamine-6-phosphate epimerase